MLLLFIPLDEDGGRHGVRGGKGAEEKAITGEDVVY